MRNPFCYLQLHTSDPEMAKKFYGQLFDWQYQEAMPEMPPYTEINAGPGIRGGMMQAMGMDVRSHWMPYVQVDDLKTTVQKASDLGATIIVPPSVVPGRGIFSVIGDPTGAEIALWQVAT